MKKLLVNKAVTSNSSSTKDVFLICKSTVKKDAVRRERYNERDHYVISSATLPDDIVMNGILYPANEIEASFETLEMTPAPLEHPVVDNQYVSASDPRAINGFWVGAWNANVSRKDGRVYVEKWIDIETARCTDRGKRLLDRINELETSESPRPIHTSVGVFLEVDELDEPQTNAAGMSYQMVAKNMVFDHDAILLDSAGAAQPSQGVGMAVNRNGKKLTVCSTQMPLTKNEGESFDEIRSAVYDAFTRSAVGCSYIIEMYPDKVIFEWQNQTFEVPYVLDSNGRATIAGIPVPVEVSISYEPKTNHSKDDVMKELILNALKEAGIKTDDLNDDQLLAAYNDLLKVNAAPEGEGNQNADQNADQNAQLSEIVANAVAQANKDMAAQLSDIKKQLNANQENEVTKYAEIIANSGKYAGLDIESAKLLPVAKLKEMAANCKQGHGLSPLFDVNAQSNDQYKFEMPA